MKYTYEKPDLKVISFDTKDVITESGYDINNPTENGTQDESIFE